MDDYLVSNQAGHGFRSVGRTVDNDHDFMLNVPPPQVGPEVFDDSREGFGFVKSWYYHGDCHR
jgi:hypothetical protein